jgi:hypothetical protein
MVSQAVVLHLMGRVWICSCGTVRLWVGDIWSSELSQQLFDWYTPSHIVHGILFYGMLWLLLPRTPVLVRLAIAVGIEASWEIAENSPWVIEAYRKQALAAGYTGDSILNSLSDTLMMSTGFFIASRLRAPYVVAIALTFEIFTACMIRDNLTLNVINLIAPSDWSPIQAIHSWQAGAKH